MGEQYGALEEMELDMANQFRVIELGIQAVKVLENDIFQDNRGSSMKFYSKEAFDECGIDFAPLEVMNIHSNKNTLRGLHYQKVYGQSKVIYCYRGRLLVVAVDILPTSSTYGKWCSTVLDSSQKIMYIPKECAVGSLAIEDADFMYLCGEHRFMKEYEAGIKWNDETLNIAWESNSTEKIISIKDANLPTFDEIG